MTASDAKVKKLAVYTIIENANANGGSLWRLVGNAYVNRDESLTVLLDALPLNGRLHIRPFAEKDTEYERKET